MGRDASDEIFLIKATGRDIHSSDSSSRGSSKGDGVVDAAAGEESESSEEDECDEEDDGKKKSPASLISRRLSTKTIAIEKKKKKKMMMNRGRPSSNFVRVARKSIEDYILPEKGCNWYRYEWQPFKSPARFIQCAFLIGMCLSFELNVLLEVHLWNTSTAHFEHSAVSTLVRRGEHCRQRVLRFHNGRAWDLEG